MGLEELIEKKNKKVANHQKKIKCEILKLYLCLVGMGIAVVLVWSWLYRWLV